MINPHDQQLFAVKELTNLSHEDGSPDDDAMEELLLEVRKLGTVNSEFVIKYHTSAIFRGHFYMVTELIASISHHNKRGAHSPFSYMQFDNVF